jgi:hypothetical protein
MSYSNDPETTQFLGLLFEACFPVHIPLPLQTMIIDYFAPSCESCRSEYKRMNAGNRNHLTVRKAIVQQALNNDVYRGKILY